MISLLLMQGPLQPPVLRFHDDRNPKRGPETDGAGLSRHPMLPVIVDL